MKIINPKFKHSINFKIDTTISKSRVNSRVINDGYKQYKWHFLFIVSLVTLILFTYKDYGISWDENYFLNIGKYFINALLRLIHINSNLVVQGLPSKDYFELHLKGHGVIFDMTAVFFSLFFKNFSFEIYHHLQLYLKLKTFRPLLDFSKNCDHLRLLLIRFLAFEEMD